MVEQQGEAIDEIFSSSCEVLLVVPRSTGDPLMDLTSVPDNNS